MKNTITSCIDKLQKVLMPLGSTLANQKHLQAISAGITAIIPLTILGAIFCILANPPVTEEILASSNFFAQLLQGWSSFAKTYYTLLMTPYNMTMGCFSLVAVFAIAYNLAKAYKLKPLSCGIVATVTFLMICAPATSAVLTSIVTKGADVAMSATNMIPVRFLGSEGMFPGIIIALFSVEINRFCEVKNITIKMPESVPATISDSFSAIIPIILNVVILYGLNVLLIQMFALDLPNAIMTLLTPGIQGINSIWGIIFIGLFSLTLWVFGINGSAIVLPIIMPILMSATLGNGELIAAGKETIFNPIFVYQFTVIGGTGATFALSLLMARSKSIQSKTVGRIGIVPGLLGINEPIIFGAPIVFNPVLAIPFIFIPIINMIIGYLAYMMGVLAFPKILIMGFLPIGVSDFMATGGNIMNLLFPWILVLLNVIMWYPFFKIQERNLLVQENGEKKA